MPSDTLAIVTMPLDGLRILVVEDEPDSLEVLTMLLTVHGATVTAAASAREALDLLTEARPDILVSDIGMPGEDGYALIRKIRAMSVERGGHIPAIALTGFATPIARAAAFAAGFQAHLAKPVEPDKLVSMIKSLVRTPAES